MAPHHPQREKNPLPVKSTLRPAEANPEMECMQPVEHPPVEEWIFYRQKIFFPAPLCDVGDVHIQRCNLISPPLPPPPFPVVAAFLAPFFLIVFHCSKRRRGGDRRKSREIQIN